MAAEGGIQWMHVGPFGGPPRCCHDVREWVEGGYSGAWGDFSAFGAGWGGLVVWSVACPAWKADRARVGRKMQNPRCIDDAAGKEEEEEEVRHGMRGRNRYLSALPLFPS